MPRLSLKQFFQKHVSVCDKTSIAEKHDGNWKSQYSLGPKMLSCEFSGYMKQFNAMIWVTLICEP